MLPACASLSAGEYGASSSRPALHVEQRPWHAGILNPRPPAYGLDAPGGCIPSGEFRVEIDSLSFDPATHRLTIRVYVGLTGSPHWTIAQLIMRRPNGEAVTKVIVRETRLVLSVDPRETPVLSLERIASRALHLDLLTLSRRAEHRGRSHRDTEAQR
jgi:hypothetical protein